MRTAYRKPVQKAFNQRMATPNAQNTPFKVELSRDGRSLLEMLKARLFSS
jgi:hypothetical protein